MRTLKAQGRYLAWDDGTPFFYLGDTAWELFHRLNREEMDHYFAERARQGFTAVQAVALAEFEGVTVPNAYGRLPLHFADGLPDPTSPDLDAGYSYWDHVDYAVEAAAQRRLFLVILPTWGDKFHLCWGKGPEIFDEANAYAYGKWIAARYRDKWNILWMLGGDRPLEPKHRAIVDAMAAGIREADANHLITFHPPGAKDSTDFLADAPYIDFHTAQTGHGIEQCYRSDEVMAKMAAATGKPYLDSEPRYEDHPACFNDRIGYFWNAQAGRAPERLLGRPGGRWCTRARSRSTTSRTCGSRGTTSRCGPRRSSCRRSTPAWGTWPPRRARSTPTSTARWAHPSPQSWTPSPGPGRCARCGLIPARARRRSSPSCRRRGATSSSRPRRARAATGF